MSIETVDTRDRAAAAVALVRHRAPETRFLPIGARPVPEHPGYVQVNRVDRTRRALPGGAHWLTTFEGAGLDGVIAKRLDGPYGRASAR